MLKKLKNIGLAALLSFNLISCGSLIPEGQKVKTDADGIISVEEYVQIKSEFESENGIDGFNPVVQNFVNDVDVYLKNEFSRRGFKLRGITNDLHIYMPEDDEEFAEKYKEVCLREKPEAVVAFYGSNKTIYIPKTYEVIFSTQGITNGKTNINLAPFYDIFFHELGHHLRFGMDEYGSKANESYAPMKLYMLNKKLGLQTIIDSLCFLPKENTEDYFEEYDYGCVNFVIQANGFNGNLEAGFNHILTAPQLQMESYLRDVLNQYSTISDAYLYEFEKLLFSEGFRNSFDKLKDNEFNEMRDFFQAYIYYATSREDKFSGYGGKELFNKSVKYSEDFLENYENPFFKGKLVNWLSDYYNEIKLGVMGEIFHVLFEEEYINREKLKELLFENYDLNYKLININAAYPCEYRFSECTKSMSKKRLVHIAAYFDLLKYHSSYINEGVNPDELIGLGEEFVNKFYPDKDFTYENNSFSLAYMGAYTNYFTASILKNKLYFIENSEEFKETCEKAKLFFEYVKLGSCKYVSDEYKRKECDLAFGSDTYKLAQEEILKLKNCVIGDYLP